MNASSVGHGRVIEGHRPDLVLVPDGGPGVAAVGHVELAVDEEGDDARGSAGDLVLRFVHQNLAIHGPKRRFQRSANQLINCHFDLWNAKNA